MLIEVTQEDINCGCKGLSCDCPISIATNKKIQSLGYKTYGTLTTLGSIYIYMMDKRHSFDLPIVAAKFVRDFDSDKDVEPFSFEIPLELKS